VIIKLLAPLVVAVGALAAPAVYWTLSPARTILAGAAPRRAVTDAGPFDKLPGKLVLAGGTFIDEMGAEFVRLAGGPEARLVLIPTAYGPTEEEGIEQFYEQWRVWKPGKITVLHTRDRTVANDPNFVGPLKDATGVWFYGGQQVRLVDTYAGTLVEQELRALFQRGGAIGGNCAGAMALGETMIVGNDWEDEQGDEVVLRPGLGIVPKMVADSHYLERNRIERLRGVIADKPDHFGLGIDGATAVVIDGGELRCIGKSYVATIVAGDRPREVRFDIWDESDRVPLSEVFAVK
jgi:cyanophycinase